MRRERGREEATGKVEGRKSKAEGRTKKLAHDQPRHGAVHPKLKTQNAKPGGGRQRVSRVPRLGRPPRSPYRHLNQRSPSPAADEGSEEAVGCEALSGFTTMFHRYHYFSSGVSCFQIPDGLRDIAQRVAPVDDRSDFSGFEKLSHDDQVIFAQMRQKREQLLTHEP